MRDNALLFPPPFPLENTKMKRIVLAGLALAALSGCVSDQQYLDQNQAMALNSALSRARFQMNCPGATGQVLSRQVVQPVINAPRYGGVERAEYTIGIEGCGQRTTMVVICSVGASDCFAADGRN
jgi:hypothetical protein